MDDWEAMSGKARRAFTLKILSVYGWNCCICGLSISPGEESCQHVIPRSKGGVTTVDNCKPAHRRCNFALGAKHSEGVEGIIYNGLAKFI